jgi:aminoglycoside phosphotransferase (APT) family kinase protein
VNGREVAKLAFGAEGREVIEGEAEAIRTLPEDTRGAPEIHGVHHGPDFSMLRMPYVRGLPLEPSRAAEALALLDSWITDAQARSMREFPEWAAMHASLARSAAGQSVLADLENMQLRPVIRHGDFARWNLIRQNDGSLIALDWEWGHPAGMPGLDLVHYFLQDARLVERMEPSDAIAKTRTFLKSPACRDYLAKTGWNGDPLLPIIASLAWKQGAGHQENEAVLEAALGIR